MSNYEKMKRQMRSEFLKYDQRAMIERFGLEASDDYLTFELLGGACRVNRKTGDVECANPLTREFAEADYNEAMTAYDLLCWSKPGAAPSGRYVNMQSLAPMYSATTRLGAGMFSEEAAALDGRDAELRRALERLGGVPASGGNVAAEIAVFRDLKVIFRFWNSDDEFEPQLQLLWDANALMYMHYETVWYAGGVLVRRLCEIVNA